MTKLNLTENKQNQSLSQTLGILQRNKCRMKVDFLIDYKGRKCLNIWGDGCVFPVLEKEQVDELLLMLVDWIDLESKCEENNC